MKKGLFLLAVILALPLLFISGKSESKRTISIQNDSNLIANPNFDTAFLNATDSLIEYPVITGWHLSFLQQQPIFVLDAPSGYGKSSLGLIPCSDKNNLLIADYYISNLLSNSDYTLTFWLKIIGHNNLMANGSVTVGVYKNEKILVIQSDTVANQDTNWVHSELNFSLNTIYTDTIIIQLNGGIALPSTK